jgi:hypothetical protein
MLHQDVHVRRQDFRGRRHVGMKERPQELLFIDIVARLPGARPARVATRDTRRHGF